MWALAPAPQVECGSGGLEARGLQEEVKECLNDILCFFDSLDLDGDDFYLDDERPWE